jgi:Domain of unknown function (DUF4139)/N-terminal domain of unknown function (DUF4140)
MSAIAVLDTEICRVTVFRQGAEVERQGALLRDSAIVRIAELPLSMSDDSVKVTLKNAGHGVVAGQVSVGVQVTGVTEETPLATELEEAIAAERLGWAKLEAAQRLFHALNELTPACRPESQNGEPPPPQQLEGQLALLDFRQEQMERVGAEVVELQQSHVAAKERVRELEVRENQAARHVKPEELRKFVQIRLSQACQSEAAELSLSYRVRGARWAPAYTARFNPELDQVEFSMRALVAQSSEEDWSQVRLAFSTAHPLDWRDCPELKSRRIGRARPAALPHSWRPPPTGTADLYREYDTIRTRVPHELEPPAAPPPPEEPIYKDKTSELAFALAQDEFVDDSWCDEEMVASASAVGGGSAAGVALRRREEPRKKEKRSDSRALDRVSEGLSQKTVMELDQRMWQYGQLRMMGAGHHRRGELVWQEHVTLYSEFSQTTSLVIQTALESTEQMVVNLMNKPLPSGFLSPERLQGFDYQYSCQGLVDVPADGQFHSLLVFGTTLLSTPKYIAVPRESLDVFRSAELVNTSEHGLLAGPVDVFIGEDFLHSTPLQSTGPSGEILLGLGVCQSVKLTRQTHFKEGSSGLMGGTTTLPHRVETEAMNHLQRPVTLEIRERLPEVAEEAKQEIKVEIGKVEPAWEAYEPKDAPELKSAHRWVLQIPAGESVRTRLTYTVSMPAKYELVGGNRRENLS